MDQLLARQVELLQEEDLRLRQLRPVINRFILPAFRYLPYRCLGSFELPHPINCER